jgi:hypothetical protein
MKPKVMNLKSSKYLSQMMHVILLCRTKNYNVIDVTFGKTKSCQHPIHHPLKFCNNIFQIKWQKLLLV